MGSTKKVKPFFFDFEIIVVFDFIESKAVLETRTTAAVHENAQFQIGIVFFGDQVGHFGAAAFGKDDGGFF